MGRQTVQVYGKNLLAFIDGSFPGLLQHVVLTNQQVKNIYNNEVYSP